MPKLAKRISSKEPDHISAVMNRLEKKRLFPDKYLSAGGGAPSIEPSEKIWTSFCDEAKNRRKKLFTYRTSIGDLNTRGILAKSLRKDLNIDIDPSQVWQTFGGQGAIFTSLAMVLDPGDKMIKPDPDYLGYPPAIKLLSGKVVEFQTLMEEDYQIDVDKLRKVLKTDKKIKGIIFSSPANPHAKKQERNVIIELAKVLIDLDKVGIQDIAYVHNMRGTQELLYDHCPEHSITIGSGSKCFSTPAFNVGYAFTGIKELIENDNEKVSRATCAVNLTQNSLSALFIELAFGSSEGKQFIRRANKVYEERQKAMMKALDEIDGVEYAPPDSFYYVYPKLPIRDSVKFADQLYEEEKVIIVPGLAFGPSGISNVRMTTVTENKDKIYELVEKMGMFLKRYHD